MKHTQKAKEREKESEQQRMVVTEMLIIIRNEPQPMESD